MHWVDGSEDIEKIWRTLLKLKKSRLMSGQIGKKGRKMTLITKHIKQNFCVSSIMPRSRKYNSHPCPKCSKHLSSATSLENHLARVPACDELPCKCETCHATFKSKKNLDRHKRKNCPGVPIPEQNVQLIQQLHETRIAVNASGPRRQCTDNQNTNPSRSGISVNIVNQTVHNGNIPNIQVNVNVRQEGDENVDFISHISYQQLIDLIGCRRSLATHFELNL